MADWVPDVLGDEFEQLTLDLGADDEGPVVATLVRALPAPPSWWDRLSGRTRPLDDVDVLYVHGWSDYFFQKRLARFWTSRGARFFALDLRKYGRSLREGQTPGYITDLATYDEDIAAARAAMAETAGVLGRRLVLLGHSTGGLTLSLWASRHPGEASAVILNSPWLEFQVASVRPLITPVAELQARWAPREVAPQVDLGFYTRAQAEVADPDDPMTVDLAWRPAQTMAVHAGWFHAIIKGHNAVAAGLSIDAPVCVLLSTRSATPTRWSDDLTRADTVLVVDDIARAALKLGPSVTVERIDGALHDVFLSRREARSEAYARLGRWVTGWAAVGRR
ncbi:alpha/beta hydrolase [Microbacterium sp. ZW T5_45]|uniref:alpha/beta hydrolase n=1 Tax=Microbacterium sp. ZW T5_45 TaxID=3378080 RepID=UPI0038545D2B